jgi:hypothetical protein
MEKTDEKTSIFIALVIIIALQFSANYFAAALSIGEHWLLSRSIRQLFLVKSLLIISLVTILPTGLFLFL